MRERARQRPIGAALSARIAYRRTGVKCPPGRRAEWSRRLRTALGRAASRRSLAPPSTAGSGRRDSAAERLPLAATDRSSGRAARCASATRHAAAGADRYFDRAPASSEVDDGGRGRMTSPTIAAQVSRLPTCSRHDQPLGRGVGADDPRHVGAGHGNGRELAAGAPQRDDRQRELRHLPLAALAAREVVEGGGRRRPALAPIDEVDQGRAVPAAGERTRSRVAGLRGLGRHLAPCAAEAAVGAEAAAQVAQRMVDSALDGPQREPQRVRRLLERPALEVVQDHDRLVLRGQPGDPLADDLAQLGPLGARVRPDAAVDEALGDDLRDRLAAQPASAEAAVAQVQGDLVQPRQRRDVGPQPAGGGCTPARTYPGAPPPMLLDRPSARARHGTPARGSGRTARRAHRRRPRPCGG